MPTIAALPATWDDTIVRGDTFPRQFKLPGNYESADFIITARVGTADPFLELTDGGGGVVPVWDADEEIPEVPGVTGWTTVTITVSAADTLTLDTGNQGRWQIRSVLAGVTRTWFEGSLAVTEGAIDVGS